VPPGQPPTTPPGSGNLPPIPPPAGYPSGDGNPYPGGYTNTPAPAWYNDMWTQIYYSNYYFSQLEYWAYNEYASNHYYEVYIVYIYAAYLRTLMDQYYWNYYDQQGPKYFPWGWATRGDFNYGFYFWVLPVYHELLVYAYNYHSKYHPYPSSPYYTHLRNAANQYHKFANCEGGADGADVYAQPDQDAYNLEHALGL
jgi:hypothetical protein